MDGVDAVLLRITAAEHHPEIDILAAQTFAYPDDLHQHLFEVATGERVTTEQIARLHTSVAVAFANAFHQVCRGASIDAASVDFIGSHGQTVAHAPAGGFGEETIAGTLQLGPPGMIAALTGVTTVGDFRGADLALGGQGAPLAPHADFVLRRSDTENRAIVNVGGIANVTYLPAACGRSDVVAFDTGPGNMVVDQIYRALHPDAGIFDAEGQAASAGTPNEELLETLLRDPFFELVPPKSAGHREFGAPFAWQLMNRGEQLGMNGADILATAVELTVRTLTDALARHCHGLEAVYLTGGGSHNPLMVSGIAQRLGEIPLRPIDDLGIPADAKEAIDFALLARDALLERPNVIRSATGASREIILGQIALGGAR